VPARPRRGPAGSNRPHPPSPASQRTPADAPQPAAEHDHMFAGRVLPVGGAPNRRLRSRIVAGWESRHTPRQTRQNPPTQSRQHASGRVHQPHRVLARLGVLQQPSIERPLSYNFLAGRRKPQQWPAPPRPPLCGPQIAVATPDRPPNPSACREIAPKREKPSRLSIRCGIWNATPACSAKVQGLSESLNKKLCVHVRANSFPRHAITIFLSVAQTKGNPGDPAESICRAR